MSLKGGFKTAMLLEAYKNDQLIDRDPLMEIKDKFVKLLEEGHRMRAEQLKVQRNAVQKDMELVVARDSELKFLKRK